MLLGAGKRLADRAGTQATSAYAQSAHFAVGKLVTHTLQVGVETPFGLDVGMTHQVTNLRLFPAHITFSAHDILMSAQNLRANATAGPERIWKSIPLLVKRQELFAGKRKKYQERIREIYKYFRYIAHVELVVCIWLFLCFLDRYWWRR